MSIEKSEDEFGPSSFKQSCKPVTDYWSNRELSDMWGGDFVLFAAKCRASKIWYDPIIWQEHDINKYVWIVEFNTIIK